MLVRRYNMNASASTYWRRIRVVLHRDTQHTQLQQVVDSILTSLFRLKMILNNPLRRKQMLLIQSRCQHDLKYKVQCTMLSST
jgi:hypothetical protein